MAKHIKSPSKIQAAGNKPKIIEEFIGRVNSGTSENESFEVREGETIIISSGEWVRYSSPKQNGAEYIAVCLPAFSPDTVNRDE